MANWRSMYTQSTPASMFSQFTKILTDIVNKKVPFKKIRIRNGRNNYKAKQPSLPNHICSLWMRREPAFKLFKNTRTTESYAITKKLGPT